MLLIQNSFLINYTYHLKIKVQSFIFIFVFYLGKKAYNFDLERNLRKHMFMGFYNLSKFLPSLQNKADIVG